MNQNRISLLDRKKYLQRPLTLDGAIGTYLIELGIKPYRNIWTSTANLSNQKLVEKLHKDYIIAGAEIITANTFGSNPISVSKSNFDKTSKQLVEAGLSAAIEAREDKEILIAGCNAPAEDCYQTKRTITNKELDYNHKKHIELLWESGSDLIWNETQSHFDEIDIICQFCSTNNLPYVLSLYFTQDLKLLSGESVFDIVNYLVNQYNATIGFNCISVQNIELLLNSAEYDFPFGFYLNCGSGDVTDSELICGITPISYTESIDKIVKDDTLFVGACCGSNPKHIEEIRKYLDG